MKNVVFKKHEQLWRKYSINKNRSCNAHLKDVSSYEASNCVSVGSGYYFLKFQEEQVLLRIGAVVEPKNSIISISQI